MSASGRSPALSVEPLLKGEGVLGSAGLELPEGTTPEHGLSAAKDLLRHADIAITSAHYIDSPREATSGLGALLAETKGKGKKIVDFKDAAKAPRRARAASRETR